MTGASQGVPASGPFPTIVLSGSPRERGEQHGRALAAHVRANCQATYARAHAIQGLDRSALHALRAALDVELADSFPDLLEEMEGIAWGAALAVDDVLTLNSFADIALEQRCTTAIVRRSGSSAPLLFQNNDAFRSHLEHMAVVHYRDPVEHVQVTYAGVIGETGVNCHGVAVAGNSLETRIEGPGVPFTALIRKALEQETVEQAAALIDATRRCGGMAYALAGADGRALYLETSSRRGGRLEVGRRLVHTNHALSPEVADVESAQPARLERSRRRLASADELLDSAQDGEEERLMRLARDHGCGIDSVCQHVLDAADEAGAWQTLYGVIVDPVARTVLLAEGLPCQAEFHRIEVLPRSLPRRAPTLPS